MSFTYFADFDALRCIIKYNKMLLNFMRINEYDEDEIRLREVLKRYYKMQDLPRGFTASVWKRIYSVTPAESLGWSLLNLFNLIIRPQTVFAILAVAVFAGLGIGYVSGKTAVKKSTQLRYVKYVIPDELR